MKALVLVAWTTILICCSAWVRATTLDVTFPGALDLPGGPVFAPDQSLVPVVNVADSGDPYGTLTLTKYASVDCTGPGISMGTAAVRDGVVTEYFSFSDGALGTFSMSAQYVGAGLNGAGNHDYAAGACASFKVAIARPAVDVWMPGGPQYGINQIVRPRVALNGASPSIATDSVNIAVFAGADCQALNEQVQQTVQAHNGVVDGFGFRFADLGLTAGSYSIQAFYTGDGNNSAITGACHGFNIVANDVTFPAHGSVTTSLTLAPGTHYPGDSNVLPSTGATLGGVSLDAGGTFAVQLYTDSWCGPADAVPLTTKTLAVANGEVQGVATFGYNGYNSLRGYYSGDANNGPAVSACVPFSVGANTARPSLTFRGAPNFVGDIFGALQPQVTLFGSSPTAAGTVTYQSYASDFCATGTELASTIVGVINGIPDTVSSFPDFTTGSFSLRASYSGDAHNAVASTCMPYQVVDHSQALVISDGFAYPDGIGNFTASFNITRPIGGPMITVNVATADDSAVAGRDYDALNGTLVFNSNDILKTVHVTVHGTTTVSANRRFFVILSNPIGGILVDGFAKGLIIDPRDRIFSDGFGY